MSLKVTIQEEPRVFSVQVGSNEIGRVTSYFDKGEDNNDAYDAECASINDDYEMEYETIGYYGSLKEAAGAVIEYGYGEGKIDKIVERLI